MKLIADDAIVLVEAFFGDAFEIETLATADITANALKDADALLIRSTLKVDANLLAGSRLRCIATTTSGYDHIDTSYCEANNIPWFHAAGCNATSVAEYVICVIAALQKKNRLQNAKRAAIIGVGQVGSRLATRLARLGFEVLLNDPPRSRVDTRFQHTALSDIHDVDLICCHTPLTETGDDPTLGLIDADFLAKQKPGCVILNAGRGGVVDTQAMLSAGAHCDYVFDVFPNEPHVAPEIIQRCLIATPHIAGHAIQGKWRGTEMAYQQMAALFGLKPKQVTYPIKAPAFKEKGSWQETALAIYDPNRDSDWLKAQCKSEDFAHQFTTYRKSYPIRHEFGFLGALDYLSQPG